MTTSNEYNGDQCMVLPADFLKTPRAAAELYEADAKRIVNNLHVPEFDTRLTVGQLLGRLLVLGALLTLIPF